MAWPISDLCAPSPITQGCGIPGYTVPPYLSGCGRYRSPFTQMIFGGFRSPTDLILMAHPKVPISPFIVHKPLLRFDIVLGIVSRIISRKKVSLHGSIRNKCCHTQFMGCSVTIWLLRRFGFVHRDFTLLLNFPFITSIQTVVAWRRERKTKTAKKHPNAATGRGEVTMRHLHFSYMRII